MDDDGGFRFVNRTDELAFLSDLLAEERTSIAIFRSPAGYGKSRLSDEFRRRESESGARFVVVDPLIRHGGSSHLYDGYFIQKCAEALDAEADATGAKTFRAFLSHRPLSRIRTQKSGDFFRELPSWKTGYAFVFEALERYFMFGRHDPKQLLRTDRRDAIVACRDYVDDAFANSRLVVIIRQAQHLDHESLRSFLELSRSASNNVILMEYTAANGRFDPDHSKLLQRELRGHPSAHVHDLLMLGPGHLELLLNQLALPSQVIELRVTSMWDGDLRELELLSTEVTLQARIGGPQTPLLLEGPLDLVAGLVSQIEALDTTERLLLGLVTAHGEAIPEAVLFLAAQQILPAVTLNPLRSALLRLRDDWRLIVLPRSDVALTHADVAKAVREASGMGAALVLAESTLRDFYLGAFRSRSTTAVAHSIALRRALILSARTGDPQSLLAVLDSLTDEVSQANDQGVYVDVICEALAEIDDLLPFERARLVDWAAGLAYDICDFRTCLSLLETAENPSDVDVVLMIHCLIEVGDHDRASALTVEFGDTIGRNNGLRDLIAGHIALDAGDWAKATERFGAVIAGAVESHSAYGAQALRLVAEILEYPSSTSAALKSVAWFEERGLRRCAAYSALSASRFLAREGRGEEARRAAEAAASTLQRSVRDDHLIRNARALAELLSERPDFQRCVDELRIAIRSSRDDFSDLVILTNLALANCGVGDEPAALDCVERATAILDNPGFAERDVFWPVCFNLGWVLDKVGREQDAQAMRSRPSRTGWQVRSNDAYWAWRYGETEDVPDHPAYLVTRPYHPVALSHWQLDREAVGSPIAG